MNPPQFPIQDPSKRLLESPVVRTLPKEIAAMGIKNTDSELVFKCPMDDRSRVGFDGSARIRRGRLRQLTYIVLQVLKTDAPRRPGHQIRQKRGRKTYDALVAAGFELLESHDFSDITVAELARHAGYSVGAFYARFHSKDEFLDALLEQHFENRRRSRARMIARSTRESLVHDIVKELVLYYWQRRQFWRAALLRAMRDQAFWKPLRDHGNEAASTVLAEVTRKAGRELTDCEKMNVRFAFELALGAINNSIVNRPGPVLFLGQARFIENLARAFTLVSNYDALVCDAAPD